MKIYRECSLTEFEPWSGAKYAYNMLTLEQLEELDQTLEYIYPDGIDETDLNDLFWFEEDTIAQMLDFEDFEALERYNNGEEEEEEEEEEN